MPVYCYRCRRCGRVTDVFRHRAAGCVPPSARCAACGGPARRDYAAEASVPRAAETGEIVSVSAGVNPDQAADAERRLAHLGVRFDRRTGDAIFRNRRHKLRCIKAMGLHDKDEARG